MNLNTAPARSYRSLRPWSGVVAAAALVLASASACEGVETAPPEDTREEAAEEVSATEQPLDGRIRYQTGCRPFTAALIERSTQYARIVTSSPAFEQCVRATMAERYMNCADPNKTVSPGVQADRVIETLKNMDNHLTFACNDGPATASGSPQGYQTRNEHGIIVESAFNKEYGWWNTYGTDPGAADDYEPWNDYAGIIVHEYLHTHDYRHMDWSCIGQCANPTCAWTSTCGGTGVPPPGVTSIGTAGQAQQEFCAWQNQGNDDEAYYRDGEPSLPYIVDNCAHDLVVQSHAACGKASAPGACSDWSALRLLSSWSGVAFDEQPAGAACGCYDDPRKVVALRTDVGQAVTAINGGGDVTSTNWSTATGAWQWFYLIDQSAGALNSGDAIQLKTHGGQWILGNYTSSAENQLFHIITRASGSGPIGHNTAVKLSNFWHNPATSTNEWRYAFASPTVLTHTPTQSAPQNTLVLERPRRDTLVHLRGNSGYYLRVNATGGPMMAWTDLLSNLVIAGTHQQQGEAAFWLIDHNGGDLVSGDSISLEAYYNDVYAYLSVSGVGTGQVRTTPGISPSSKFIVTKDGGSGVIGHNDTITLKSWTNNLLTAALPTAGGQLTNSGSPTAVTNAQRFVLRHVSQHDRARPTW